MASHHDVVRRVLDIKSKLSGNPLQEREKILRLLEKLTRLPVDVKVLQETGIGKCVNGLKRKCPELTVQVKPLINSWKLLVQTAMEEEAEQKQGDSSREESTETAESGKDRIKHRTHPHPKLIIPDRSSVHHPSSEESATSGKESNGSSSSPERKKLQKRRKSHELDVPPTPVPWSPEQKVFPPYIPKKERSDEDESKTKSLDLTNHRKEKYDRPKSPSLVKTESKEPKSSKSRPSQVKPTPNSNAEIKHRTTSDTRPSNTLHLTETSDKKSSTQSHKKPKLESSNILLNDTKGVKVSKDTSKSQQQEHGHTKVKKRPRSVPPEDDPGSLFQPDVAKVRTKDSAVTEKDKRLKVKNSEHSNKHDLSPKQGQRQKQETCRQSDDKKKIAKEHQTDQKTKSRVEKASTGIPSETSQRHLSKAGKEEGQSPNVRNKSAKTPKTTEKSSSSRVSKPSNSVNPKGEETGITFESTGMSFEDCLFGGSIPPVKKPKVAHKNKVQKALKDKKKDVKSSHSSSGPKGGLKNSETRRHREENLDGRPKKRKSTSEAKEETKVKKYQSDEESMREASASDVEMSLPDIRPDYKPSPKLPELKAPEKKRDPTGMQWFGSKQTKTKVYSGKQRKRHWDTLPSLQDICKEVIFDNIEALYDTGGVPFYLLEDVLEKCTAPQLLRIEDYNPDYVLESDHLWKKHTMRSFGGAKPEEMESWRELYLRKKDEREYKLLTLTANISASMAKKDSGRLTKLAFVDKPVKPPRNVVRQQLKHGTAKSLTPAKAPQPRKAVPVVHHEQTSSHRVIPEREPAVSPVRKRTAKVVAPMMQKSLKLMKKVNSRR